LPLISIFALFKTSRGGTTIIFEKVRTTSPDEDIEVRVTSGSTGLKFA
jgi:hypothetical protein